MDPIARFLASSLTLDPEFGRLRRELFDAPRQWLEVPSQANAVAWIARRRLRLRGVGVRSLESAFGRDNRLWTGANGEIAEVVRAISDLKQWDMAFIDLLSPAETAAAVAAATTAGLGHQVMPNPITALIGIRDHDALLASRSSATNREQRRSVRRIAERGLEFRASMGWPHVEQLLDARRLPAHEADDYTRDAEFRRFFREYRDAMSAAGRLREVALFDHDRPVAYVSGVWSGRVFHAFQTAHDPEYRSLRPGIMVFEKLLEGVLAEECEILEFMGSGRFYLSEFTRQSLPLQRVVLFSRTLKARLLGRFFARRARRAADSEAGPPT
ncbi:MAG: GNAT family N-acetyltransferase [Gemmatimonadaceae bacterium]|nr:GNAT family N-acetyltransferase [Gemmatimonadaceae bacterium]